MKNSSLHKKGELFVDVLCHMVVLDAAPRPTPLSPVPESSTGSQSIHGLGVPGAAPLSMCLHVDLAISYKPASGAARSYRQLPPVLEGAK